MIFRNKHKEVEKYLKEYKDLVKEGGEIPTPCGHYVLVRVVDIEEVSQGGIITATKNEHEREQNGHDVGVVMLFGKTAYQGFSGCESSDDWGVAAGDVVEFNRYDGKLLRNPLFKSYRVINDNDIHLVYGSA